MPLSSLTRCWDIILAKMTLFSCEKYRNLSEGESCHQTRCTTLGNGTPLFTLIFVPAPPETCFSGTIYKRKKFFLTEAVQLNLKKPLVPFFIVFVPLSPQTPSSRRGVEPAFIISTSTFTPSLRGLLPSLKTYPIHPLKHLSPLSMKLPLTRTYCLPLKSNCTNY